MIKSLTTLAAAITLSFTISAYADNPTTQDKVDGTAQVSVEGESATYTLMTGWLSSTNFKDPKQTTIVFATQPDIKKNPSRIRLTADVTKTGSYTVTSSKGSRIPKIEYIAKGGQIFPVKDSCQLVISKAELDGNSRDVIGKIHNCTVYSAGVTKVISAEFQVENIPATS